jgi:hypothetical protein
MQLTDAQIEEYREIHKDYFGVEISRKEAIDGGQQLIRMMQVIYQPITTAALKKYEHNNDDETTVEQPAEE